VDTVNFDGGSFTVTWTNPISAQRVLAHLLPPGFLTLDIGSVGPRSVAERGLLTFMLRAPSLDPPATTFRGTNLPAGALLDPTGIFHWSPAANQAGGYPGVHLEATDGTQTVSEDVTITVTEANLSFGGQVTKSDGTPAAGVALKLGSGANTRTLFTDVAGGFRFEDLTPGSYAVRLTRPSLSQYVASPRPLEVTVAGTDRNDANLVVTPK